MPSRLEFLFFLSAGVFIALFPALPHAASSTFNIYAYGGSAMGGLPLLYYEGYAYVNNATSANSSFTSIYFTESPDSPTTWIAHPNTTASSNANANFTNQALAIPRAGSSTKQIGFVSGNSSAANNETVPEFHLYGETVFVVNSTSGEWETRFYAGETDSEGVWMLLWGADEEEEEGVFPVSLRTMPPSN
ncbi:hypothetical protein VTN96DRAFT_8640 [Rasamsonia emersonii]